MARLLWNRYPKVARRGERQRRIAFETLEPRALLAGDISLVRYFDTWGSGMNLSPDPGDLAYHAPSGHMFLVDPNINTTSGVPNRDENIFEISLRGDQVYRRIVSNNEEPTGITYNAFDGYFYVTQDTGDRGIKRYDDRLNTPLALVETSDAVSGARDPEDITSDPYTGFLYVTEGANEQVLVYDSNLQFQYHFSVGSRVADPEGIAFHPTLRHLFLSSSSDQLFEYTLDGTFVESYDYSGFSPTIRRIYGLEFAPTSDPNDAAGALSLYMTDRGGNEETDGRIYEMLIGGAPPAQNMAPVVSAGDDQSIGVPDLSVPAESLLDAMVFDDGLPDPPGAVSTQWTLVSGPAAVTFADSSAVDTTVSLPVAGSYVLRLTAGDGALTASDELTIVVEEGVAPSVNVRVAASSDDAEETLSSGSVDTNSSDLELIRDGTQAQIVGMRFNGVAIPAGVTVQKAYVQFQVDEADSESTSLLIQGQATDHAATFSQTGANLSSRPRTAASVGWSPAAWTTVGQAGLAQQTPDIAAVIQEIINRPGWTSGNSLAILITGSGVRVAESYDGLPAGAPLLHVEFLNTQPGQNTAPLVTAGNDQTLIVADLSSPVVASLDATVTDDGLPSAPGVLTTQWTMVSGPAAVTFQNALAVDSTVSLPAEGTYVLRLTANDGELETSDELTITVRLQNTAPLVAAGDDQTLIVADLSSHAVASLDATVSDDGRPTIPGAVVTQWTMVSGPAAVSFADASAVDTTVNLPSVGTYVLRLTADDGELTTSDELTVTVESGQNLAPLVDAGNDQMLMVPNLASPAVATLDATVSDDGLPTTPGAVVTQWSMVSGPATASFADTSAADTTVSLPAAGTYVLRLTASDGELETSDEVLVVVQDGVPLSVDVRVAASSDDAEETLSTGGVDTNSSDLELIRDGTQDQIVGVRFNGVAIPPGATIHRAYVQFQADEAQSGSMSLMIQGEATDHAATFAQTPTNISSRSRTTASVSWSPVAWPTVGEAVFAQQTSDIAAVIQEIANRPGWTSGNALAILVTGSGLRTAESYDGLSTAAPLLHVEFFDPQQGQNRAPLVNAGNDQMIAVADLSNPAVASLDATVSDDGLPAAPGAVTTAWTLVDGPATVSFADASAVDTTVSLPAAGTYVLRLTANDGELASSDDLIITVQEGLSGSVDVRVSASSDDAEERLSSNKMYITSTDLDITFDDGRQQIVGLRFNGLAIPPGATIHNAYLQFQADEVNSESMSLIIQAEATDHAATFSAIAGNISSRPRTTASVGWSPAPWTTRGAAGLAEQTPNMAAVIQEIVSRPGWTGGNSLAVFITGSGVRTAEAYDGVPAAAPLLHIEFTTAGGSSASLMTASYAAPPEPEEQPMFDPKYAAVFDKLAWAVGEQEADRFRTTVVTEEASVPSLNSLLLDLLVDEPDEIDQGRSSKPSGLTAKLADGFFGEMGIL